MHKIRKLARAEAAGRVTALQLGPGLDVTEGPQGPAPVALTNAQIHGITASLITKQHQLLCAGLVEQQSAHHKKVETEMSELLEKFCTHVAETVGTACKTKGYSIPSREQENGAGTGLPGEMQGEGQVGMFSPRTGAQSPTKERSRIGSDPNSQLGQAEKTAEHAPVVVDVTASPRKQEVSFEEVSLDEPIHKTDEGPAEKPTLLRAFFYRLNRFVNAPPFEIFFNLLICFNAITILMELEVNGRFLREDLGLNKKVPGSEESDWDMKWTKAFFENLEHVLAVAFLVEVILRILGDALPYLKSGHSWVDITIVGITCADLYILPAGDSNRPNLSFLRLLRLFRMVKMLRIIRLMKVFSGLRVLVHTIVASLAALFWAILFLFVLLHISTIFVVQVFQEYCLDEGFPLEVRVFLLENFGFFSYALLTMFELSLPGLGGWNRVVRRAVLDVNPMFGLFFPFYVATVCFASIQIISSIFLMRTMDIANKDSDMIVIEKMKEAERYLDTLRSVLEEADTSGDGTINREEFDTLLANSRVLHFLAILELDVKDITDLFDLIDTGEGCISREEFLEGIFCIRGGAKAADVVSLIYETQKVMKGVRRVNIATKRRLRNAQIEAAAAEAMAVSSMWAAAEFQRAT